MTSDVPRALLHRTLRTTRAQLVAKVDGLSDLDARRPLTPTGTNLLGLVKHVASVQLDHLGVVFARPSPRDPLPWNEPGAAPDADLWVPADQTRADVLDLWEHSCAHADATVEALPLDAVGTVPWWPPDRARVTLHQILVRLVDEVARHAGHADVLRELVDGAVGLYPGDPSITPRTAEEWAERRGRIAAAARAAAGG